MAGSLLSAQLQRLRADRPGGEGDHASILFAPSEAKSIDAASLLTAARAGLTELELLDPDLAAFQNSLMHQGSLRVDRELLDAAVPSAPLFPRDPFRTNARALTLS